MSLYIIAEAGSTHDGSLEKARELIQVAKAARADAVKFQWLSNPESLCERRRAPEYLDAYRIIAFPYHWHVVLANDCLKAGIDYLCTTYLPTDVEMIAGYVPRFKIASFEAADPELLEAHMPFCRNRQKPLIVSTGMGDDALLVDLRTLAYVRNVDLWILHCVSSYPAPLEALNLAVIRGRDLDGFSDHSGRVMTGALAVGAGAKILEVHFRLTTTDPNNRDFLHSLTPDRLTRYIELAREAHVAMGSPVKSPQVCEEAMMPFRVLPI